MTTNNPKTEANGAEPPTAVRSSELVSRTDTDLLNALQELPCSMDIIYRRGHPKSDSAPTLREQINRFLDAEESAANASSSLTAAERKH